MKVNFHVDKNIKEKEHVDFYVKSVSPQLNELANHIQSKTIVIWGIKNKELTPLTPDNISHIYTDNGKVLADTSNNTYKSNTEFIKSQYYCPVISFKFRIVKSLIFTLLIT